MVATLADAPFKSPELETLLVEGGQFTWAAGPLAKGSNLCHGTGGNGYAFLKLYRQTKDLIWLERARAFAMTAIANARRSNRGRTISCSFSLVRQASALRVSGIMLISDAIHISAPILKLPKRLCPLYTGCRAQTDIRSWSAP